MTYSYSDDDYPDYQDQSGGENKKILGLPPVILGGLVVVALIIIALLVVSSKDSISEDSALEYLESHGYIFLDGSENFDMANFKIVNVADGTNDTDAINRGQLDSQVDTLNNAIDTLESSVATTESELLSEIDQLQVVWASTGGDIDEINNRIDSLSSAVDGLTGNYTALDGKITALDERVTALEEATATYLLIPEDSEEGDILAFIGGIWNRIAHGDIEGWLNGTVVYK